MKSRQSPQNTLPFFQGDMSEKLLQFIWQFQHFNTQGLTTLSGEPLMILYPGLPNQNQGPDFLDARIRIADTLFAGNIELHMHTSGWEQHHHHQDPNFSNVILHVVFRHDRPAAPEIPVLELEPRISGLLIDRYHHLMHSAEFISCAGSLPHVPQIVWASWKERLMVERLRRKSDEVFSLMSLSQNSWEEVFWWLLARNFGISVNSDAFEAVARSLPFTVLTRHIHQIHQLEALLLGQAGLLREKFRGSYPVMLRKEYGFLARKYELRPVSMPVHFMRMRPGNFPTVRLAQLAMLLQQHPRLLDEILDHTEIKSIWQMLAVTANDYWHYHYRLDRESSYREKKLGDGMIRSILLNTVSPVVFSYGEYHRMQHLKDRVVEWLFQLPAEDNLITRGFESLGIRVTNAYDSQALVELKNSYCNQRRCLECSVGNMLLKD